MKVTQVLGSGQRKTGGSRRRSCRAVVFNRVPLVCVSLCLGAWQFR